MKNTGTKAEVSASKTFDDGQTHEHPAFGTIRVSRVSTTDKVLFGSRVKHTDVLKVEITGAVIERTNHEDHIIPTLPVLSLYMSTNQFAEFISSTGERGGVPCTLASISGKGVLPEIAPENPLDRISKETMAEFENLDKMLAHIINDTDDALRDARMSQRKRDAILAPIQQLKSKLTSTLPFLQSQFYEDIEEMIYEAKGVVSAHARSLNLPDPDDTKVLPSEMIAKSEDN